MTDEMFMHRALQLAALGLGKVSPNPMVGCVIVHERKIMGEGYHQQYGGPHAEVKAVENIKEKELLKESTVYVSLEPCSHHGKTPPCADLLVRCQIKKVMICNVDPNPLVSGRGVKKLKEAGIDVEIGLLEQEAKELNKRFFTAFEKKRPYVILKWAQTTDGFIARENFDSKWISNQYSRQLVHKWRSEEDAILVATNTAKYDDPSLMVRDWSGRNPIRIVLDRNLSLDPKLKLFDEKARTICFSEKEGDGRNCEIVTLRTFNIDTILVELHKRGINSVLVEGGSKLLRSFISGGLWDEARVFISKTTFEHGIPAPEINGNLFREESVFDDKLLYFRN